MLFVKRFTLIIFLTLCLSSIYAQKANEPRRENMARNKSKQNIKKPLTAAEAIKLTGSSIVQIQIAFEIKPLITTDPIVRDISLGTGFFVNEDGYVVTANHVVDIIPPNLQGRMTITDAIVLLPVPHQIGSNTFQGSFSGYQYEITDQDKRHDLALLKLKINPFKNSPITIAGNQTSFYKAANLHEARPEEGTQIAVSGYPLKNRNLVTSVGWLASAWETNSVDFQTPQGFSIPDIADVYLGDIRVNPGNSGGPVYSVATGEIIGVAVSQQPSAVMVLVGGQAQALILDNKYPVLFNSGIANIVPTKYVLALMKKNNVAVKTITKK